MLVLRHGQRRVQKCYRRHTGPVHSTQRMFEPTMSRNPPGADIKWKSRPKKGEENCPKSCFKMKGRRKVLYHRVARCEELRNIVHPPRQSQWADLDVSVDPATCGASDAECLLSAHQQLKLCQSHDPCSSFKYKNGAWMNIDDALSKKCPKRMLHKRQDSQNPTVRRKNGCGKALKGTSP